MSLLNKLLPPPLTNPFFRTPGQALDAVIKPIQEQTGIPGSYQFIEQAVGKLLQPSTPMQRAKVGQPMVLGGKLGYKSADGSWQPRGDMESENIPQYIQGKGYSYDQSPAADRAYEAEKSRVAQLTAQDPELQRYEAARKLAVAPGATPEQVQSAEDIGMQIWQQKYGGTPMGQPGGAVGSYNPLMERTFGYQSGMSPQQMQEMQATAAPVPVAPGEVPYQQGDLGTRATLETGYDPAQYGLSPNLVEEMKERLLKQAEK